ncbi:fumarylacetoacetate hydrolase [Novosphingobium sp. FSY-8]|uniref:Fumarylacetoacetate hydrolase n=1 Tax=Novosphingobium ovatum TaxID=1908523 RepID=A0ABW9XBP9_9SPHN|nr:fumarylacetoacetate hydrolase family protein [Novosphingobium ovatum]NBC35956.1 fumarylacetoacetate hydrolase [Novosphingobium ovatum]
MRLATLHNGKPDGELVVVSDDGARYLAAPGLTLLSAIENWADAAPVLERLSGLLAQGQGGALDPARIIAPMPRSWQWLDGSAFNQHGELMQVAFHLPPVPTDRPLMYQGLSDRFYAPTANVPFNDPALGIDFEGEFGIIVDAVPMGVSVEEAASHIKLIVQINDWSLRAVAPVEMKTGFGWVQAKPPCGMAPFAVTPDVLGDQWRDGRVCADLFVEWNGAQFGLVNGEEMAWSFPQLVAHAARTRDLVAGTIIGSGTVSNAGYATRGSACISERRAIEMIADGSATTAFMAYGDRVRMEARLADGSTPFGMIDQTVVQA